jgi:hypothetical protein
VFFLSISLYWDLATRSAQLSASGEQPNWNRRPHARVGDAICSPLSAYFKKRREAENLRSPWNIFQKPQENYRFYFLLTLINKLGTGSEQPEGTLDKHSFPA